MDIYCINTENGFLPHGDSNYDKKAKLKIGQVYKMKVTKARNYEFHKKYFALINCAWEYQNEGVTDHFKNRVDLFRKTVEMAAGHCDTFYSIDRDEWIECPKSISFEGMDEIEFQELYERVKDVLFAVFLTRISEEDFMKNLANF